MSKESAVSEAIRNARLRVGISQAELAKRMKTSANVVSRLESRRYHGHTTTTLAKIAKALGMSLVIAFGVNDERK